MSPISCLARVGAALGLVVTAACVGTFPQGKSDARGASPVFYALTGEMALSRHQTRLAALQYAQAAQYSRDVGMLRRASDVTAECLQPSLTVRVAARWLGVDPSAVDAHRAAAGAALELHQIEQSAAEYRVVLDSSARGIDAEFAALEREFASTDNIFGARQVADHLAKYFPESMAALRMQAFTELRADDPAAAARTFQAALAQPGPTLRPAAPGAPLAQRHESTAAPRAPASAQVEQVAEPAENATLPEALPTVESNRRELTQGWWRARILAGELDEPLAQAQAVVERDETAESRLDYALLLLAAQQNSAARSQLMPLTHDPKTKPMALRLLGLVDFQEDRLTDAGARFVELTTTGQYMDDAFYYLGLIAERHADVERALRLYLQVQGGDNLLAALLRAASLLRANGAAPAAEELLDQLVEEEPQRAPEILVARSRIYSDAGDTAQAIAVLERAQQQYPDSVQIAYALASTSEEQGKVAGALRLLKDVAARRPSDPAALNAYGYTLADHRLDLEAARKLIERAYAAAPKNAAILDSMGWVRFRQGHGDQALAYLTEAYADDHDGDIAAHLGEVLWSLGRHPDAKRVWTEASRTDPANHLLKATQLRLNTSN